MPLEPPLGPAPPPAPLFCPVAVVLLVAVAVEVAALMAAVRDRKEDFLCTGDEAAGVGKTLPVKKRKWKMKPLQFSAAVTEM